MVCLLCNAGRLNRFMAYDPDLQKTQDILETPNIFKNKDRQHVYDVIADAIHDKAGFGITRVGDRMTVRFYVNNELVQAHFALLEVDLPRDDEEPSTHI